MILIFSDSHRVISNMRDVVNKLGSDIECILHLGDLCSDARALAASFPDIKIIGVKGNCDFELDVPNEKLEQIHGKTVFLTHGHTYGVKNSYQSIITAARARNADICLFGHTHLPDIFYSDNILFLNPGSILLSKNINDPTYGTLNFSDDASDVSPCIVAATLTGYKQLKIPAK